MSPGFTGFMRVDFEVCAGGLAALKEKQLFANSDARILFMLEQQTSYRWRVDDRGDRGSWVFHD